MPEWVELLPPGTVVAGRDGRRWVNDRPEAILTAFRANRADLPLDWEHSTALLAPAGHPAPAAGWVRELELRDGGIWGRVEWTERGRQSVESREYRYVSPVIDFERHSNRIVRISSVALTNSPNLQIGALNQTSQEHHMEPEILKALGLAETATPAEAIAAIAQLKSELVTARNRAETPSLDKFVPRADYETAINRAKAAEDRIAKAEVDSREQQIEVAIKGALEVGKITPATADYHRAQCRQEGGLPRFEAFVAAAPVIAPATDLGSRQPPHTGAALNSVTMRVAEMFGNSAEDLRKYGQE